MVQYSAMQWLFFFYFYSFFGWCFESTYVSLKKKHFVNRGFMSGPFLPLYGSGAIMMLFVSMPFQRSLILTFIAGCISATLLEYVTGVIMEALFKVRYWDYSDKRFQFQGRICLGSALAWGFLTIFLTRFLHHPIEAFVLTMKESWLVLIVFLLTIWIVSDFVLAFKAALDFKELLLNVEKMRQELLKMQKRLDVLIALAENDFEEKKQEKKLKQIEKSDELRARIETQLETLKVLKQIKPGHFTESVREEIVELRTRLLMNIENRHKLYNHKDFYKRNMIKSNPGMKSIRFKEALEELKESIIKKREPKE